LETIEKNGEFENYVEMLAEREERERKQLRQRERERKRLADGDHYPSEEESDKPEQEELSDWSATESDENASDLGVNDFSVADEGGNRMQTPSLRHGKRTMSKASDSHDLSMRFNALRFLAMHLKSQNGTLNK
jgi:hypothetical protein